MEKGGGKGNAEASLAELARSLALLEEAGAEAAARMPHLSLDRVYDSLQREDLVDILKGILFLPFPSLFS